MNLLTAYQELQPLAPVFSSKDAASLLSITSNQAAKLLSQLEKHNTIVRLVRGRWAYSREIDPLTLPSILSYPMMSYVSLYTALYYHGVIEQIPTTVYAVSIGKTKVFNTPIAPVSIHHISSALFNGYDSYGKDSILLACPEKALFDCLYLIPVKSRLFKKFTELEIPQAFDHKLFKPWLDAIRHSGRRALIEQRLEEIVRD